MNQVSVPARYNVLASDTAVDDVFRNARECPDKAIVSLPSADGAGWHDVTCRELAEQVEWVAAGLIGSGIAAGDRVALMSRTRYEWMIADFAIMAVGAITVPIYETSSDSQIAWILTDSGAVAVFTEERNATRIQQLRGQTPQVSQIWTLESDLEALVRNGGAVDGEQVAERLSNIRSADLATIVYTSGTTGRPKGCMLTHANLVATVRNIAAADGVSDYIFNAEQSTLLFLPLAHILARIIQLSAVHQRVRLGHLADMRQVPTALQSFRPTVVLSVPRVFEKAYNSAQRSAAAGIKHQLFAAAEHTAIDYSSALDSDHVPWTVTARHRLFDGLVYSKIRKAMGGQVRWAVSGGAPLGAHLGHFFRGAGINVLEGYGLTETTAGGTINLPTSQRVGSVGRPIPGCTIRVQADGEILMQGPHVFAGYWHNTDATKEVIDSDGWFHTGDIGRVDDDGFVHITDRKKDIIVTSAGKNVAPAVLEDGLRSHWLVSQAAVFGDQRPYIAALITLDADALKTWQAEHGKTALSPPALTSDSELTSELQAAVDAANSAVSQAEAIKRWFVLPRDFSEVDGELTPTLKLKRHVIAQEFAAEVDALYDGTRVAT